MKVRVNDEPRQIPQDTRIEGLLRDLDLANAAVAVAVNGRFVPKSTHADHVLGDGDRIELVAPMAGG